MKSAIRRCLQIILYPFFLVMAKILCRLPSRGSEDWFVLYDVGKSAARLGFTSIAIELTEKAALIAPYRTDPKVALANYYIHSNRPSDALAQLEALPPSASAEPDSAYYSAYSKYMLGRFQEALEILLGRDWPESRSVDVVHTIAMIYYLEGDFDAALRIMRKEYNLGKGDVNFLELITTIEYTIGLYDESIQHANIILDINPNNHTALCYKSLDLLGKAQPQEAYRVAKKAVAVESGDVSSRVALGLAAHGIGNTHQVRKVVSWCRKHATQLSPADLQIVKSFLASIGDQETIIYLDQLLTTGGLVDDADRIDGGREL